MPIDFQWTGVGVGAQDVALHLYHSVALRALAGGGELLLLRHYHSRLLEVAVRARAARARAERPEGGRRQQQQGEGEEEEEEEEEEEGATVMPWGAFLRYYKLSVLDYARVVFGKFFDGACPASFAAKADASNASMCYRCTKCAARFIRRVHSILREIEAGADMTQQLPDID